MTLPKKTRVKNTQPTIPTVDLSKKSALAQEESSKVKKTRRPSAAEIEKILERSENNKPVRSGKTRSSLSTAKELSPSPSFPKAPTKIAKAEVRRDERLLSVGPIKSGKVSAFPVSAGVQNFKQIASIGLENGVVILMAAHSTDELIEALARYSDNPVPHLISEKNATLNSGVLGDFRIYSAFVPTPAAVFGLAKFGAISKSGRKITFEVNCVPWRNLVPSVFASILKTYGRLIGVTLAKALPLDHLLRKAIVAPTSPEEKNQTKSGKGLSIRGNFDGIVDELAHGWVCGSDGDFKKYSVEVLCNEEIVGIGVADLYRNDLMENGIGDGCHHFRVRLSDELFDGAPHDLEVRVVGTDKKLPNVQTAILKRKANVQTDSMPRQTLLALVRDELIDKAISFDSIEEALRTASLEQELGSYATARLGYESIQKKIGSSAALLTRIGETWLLAGSADIAALSFERAIELNSALAWAHLGLANARFEKQDVVEAQQLFLNALEFGLQMPLAAKRLHDLAPEVGLIKIKQFIEQGEKYKAAALTGSLLVGHGDHPGVLNSAYSLFCEPASNQHGRARSIHSLYVARVLLELVIDVVEPRQMPETDD